MKLFEKDSAPDLVCRGMSREYILDKTGVDVGWRGTKMQKACYGIDRVQYRIEFVKANFSHDELVGIMNQYGSDGFGHVEFLHACGIDGEQVVSMKYLAEALDLQAEYAAARKRGASVRIGKMHDRMVERYGVENPCDVPEFREKSKQTLRANYGVEYPYQSKEIFEKRSRTMKARHGAEFTLQSDALKSQVRATMMERYGGPTSMECDSIHEKIKAVTKAHFGVECSLASPVVREKIRGTMRERHGVDNPMQSPKIFEKWRAGMLARYKCVNPMDVPGAKERRIATCRERYGHDCSIQNREIRAKARQTCLEHFGVESPFSSFVVREKIRFTMQERYGVDFPMQNPEIKDKATVTFMERYGVPHPMMCPDVVDKMQDTKLVNGTFSKSAPEDVLYEKLVAVFGSDDVFRQYKCDRYPFRCDFYVKSRDLFIELNGFVGHCNHWFGSWEHDVEFLARSAEVNETLHDWLQTTWAGSDVRKRLCARRNNLNYVVFWGDEGQDIDLWFNLGCPDGQDWDREYTWLPDRVLTYDDVYPMELAVFGRSISAAVRCAVHLEFYKREFEFWAGRYDVKWGTVQARLYANRLKYLGKGPLELSNKEILRGLSISGMVRGYSIYDNSGMVEFLDEFNPKFVYDPCAGWGERMLTCALKNIKYLGIDVNAELIKAHADLIQHYDLQDAVTVHGDAGRLDMTQGMHDAVFTCPPYWNAELYTDSGAENLSYPDFLDWWERVILNATGVNTKYFAYQINQKCKADMNEILLKHGWRFIKSIPVNKNRISHMARRRGIKQKVNFEEIQIFER